jgi:DNA-binding beta-propeller fold protein YncE
MSVRDIIQAAAGVGGAPPPPADPWDLASANFQGISFGGPISQYETTSTDVKISSDGTKVYILGDTRNTVFQYNLSAPYAMTFVVFSTSSNITMAGLPQKSVSAQEMNPRGIEFKPDGTKMYVIGSTGDDINEYNLSTAWDVITASFVQVFSVAAQTGAEPANVRFKDDGTKMYVLSLTNDTVYQYSLSTAWNISTATYDSVSFSVISQEAIPQGMFFGDSGAKMYIVGTTSDTVFQYNLSSAWDLSTASYSGLSKSVGTQETSPQDVFFKDDGTIMYIIGQTGDDVNQYALSSAWDVSTASFTKVSSPSFATWYNESAPTGMYIKPDGKLFYMVGSGKDTVFPQSMSTPWDVETLAPGFFVGTQEGTPTGIAFKTDGTKMYVVGISNDTVYQYTLSTAWEVYTASYEGINFSVSGQETEPRGITFKPDGTKMYIIGSTGDDINEYNLSVAWDVSTASYVQAFSVLSETGTLPQKVEFNSDGTKMIVLSQTNNSLYEYNLSSAWDISTASYASISYGIGAIIGEGSCTGLTIANSGLNLYVIGQGRNTVLSAKLNTSYSLTNANTYYATSSVGDSNTITFKPDGTEMYTLGTAGDAVAQSSVSTAWSVQTSSLVGTFSVAAQTGTSPLKAAFKTDGTKMYVLSNTNDAIYQYSLSTAWDISTATYDSVSFSVGSQESQPFALFIDDTGEKLYVGGVTNFRTYEYALSTAWDLSTTSYTGRFSLAVAPSIGGIFIGDSGTRVYLVSPNNGAVKQFILSTPWDISTMTNTGVSFELPDTGLLGIWFKDDGLTFYTVGPRNLVFEITIS